MKVLALTNLYPPDFIGGYELACAQVVDALRLRGHDVEVLTTAPRSMPVPHVPHVRRTMRLTDTYNHYHFAKSHPVTQRVYDADARFVNAANVHALLRALDEFRPDVVYLNHLLSVGGLGLLACLEYLQVPWVWQLGDHVPVYLCTLWGEVLPALTREYSRQVRGHYIAVSQQLREEIETQGIALEGHVEVLPYWIDFEPPPCRSKFFRRGDRLRIVTSGRIERQKGLDVLIEAAARLRAAGHDDFEVEIYGKVADPEFPSLVNKLGLEGHVRFPGALPQPELFRRLATCDVFAFPTHEREPFGLAPLEAAAFGCVPLLTQMCGIAEWLVHGVHCLKAPRTAEGFAAALGRILDGSIDLAPIGRRAAAVVRRDFHLDAILPGIERVLGRAAAAPRGTPGTPDDAYRLALLGEKLAQIFVQEPLCA